jgi:hypothetical protein
MLNHLHLETFDFADICCDFLLTQRPESGIPVEVINTSTERETPI